MTDVLMAVARLELRPETPNRSSALISFALVHGDHAHRSPDGYLIKKEKSIN
jgi:hypothetical protein